ncbi:MAG: macro domain-containing protein [Desulfurococcaceae archaeon]
MILRKGRVQVEVIVGDITDFTGDAIVNPANSLMIMGGGVAGAIRRKGGEEIEKEARRAAPVPIGRAVTTRAGRLRCKHVIHAPTVQEPGGRCSPQAARAATAAALAEAGRIGARSLAFPLMGAGVGGLSPEESASAMASAFEELGEGLELRLYVLDEQVASRVVARLAELGWEPAG